MRKKEVPEEDKQLGQEFEATMAGVISDLKRNLSEDLASHLKSVLILTAKHSLLDTSCNKMVSLCGQRPNGQILNKIRSGYNSVVENLTAIFYEMQQQSEKDEEELGRKVQEAEKEAAGWKEKAEKEAAEWKEKVEIMIKEKEEAKVQAAHEKAELAEHIEYLEAENKKYLEAIIKRSKEAGTHAENSPSAQHHDSPKVDSSKKVISIYRGIDYEGTAISKCFGFRSDKGLIIKIAKGTDTGHICAEGEI